MFCARKNTKNVFISKVYASRNCVYRMLGCISLFFRTRLAITVPSSKLGSPEDCRPARVTAKATEQRGFSVLQPRPPNEIAF